jgi:hypothetical protein
MKKKNKQKTNKLNPAVSDSFAISIMFLFGLFFTYLIWQLSVNLNIAENMRHDSSQLILSHQRNKTTSSDENDGVAYVNSEMGFQIHFPRDNRRYGAKDIKLTKGNAVVFGLATNDNSYGARYAEIFQISAVPLSKNGLPQKIECIGKDEDSSIFCNKNGVELAKNDQFAFIFSGLDKFENNSEENKLMPNDFDPQVIDQVDEIIKSFKLIVS